jgi:hypothetical protein
LAKLFNFLIMGFKEVLLFILSFLIFVLAIFIYFRGKKTLSNIVFAFTCVFISFWPLAIGMFRIVETPQEAVFWSRMIYLAGVFIGISIFSFAYTFPKNKRIGWLQAVFCILSLLIFIPLIFSPWMVEGVEINQEGNRAFLGPAYTAWVVWFMVYMGWSLFLLYFKYRKLGGVEKMQVFYVLLAFAFPIIGVLPFNIFLPLLQGYEDNYKFIWFGPFFLGAMLAIITYAITRYRLMNIKMIAKRSTFFAILAGIITATYVLAAFLLSSLFFGVYTFESQLATGLIVGVLVAFGFHPFYEWLKKTTDSFLFKDEYNPEKLIAEVSSFASRTLDKDKLIKTLEEKISQSLKVDEAEIIILEKRKIKSDKKYKKGTKESLQKIVNYLSKNKNVLVLEEIKRERSEKTKELNTPSLIKHLKNINGSLVVPISVKDKLTGIFVLSSKKSGDMFTSRDIQTLETISSQVGIAIENARLYEETRNFNTKLKREVDKATRGLRAANERLRRLDRAKTDFISIASHQLRTPLTIIRGYVSMLLENNFGKLGKKQDEALRKVSASSERLIGLVEDLLNISRIESGRMEYNFKKTDLAKLIQGVYEELKPAAEKRSCGLFLTGPGAACPRSTLTRTRSGRS